MNDFIKTKGYEAWFRASEVAAIQDQSGSTILTLKSGKKLNSTEAPEELLARLSPQAKSNQAKSA